MRSCGGQSQPFTHLSPKLVDLTKSLELHKSLGSEQLTASRREALAASATGDKRVVGNAGARASTGGRFSLSPQAGLGLLDDHRSRVEDRGVRSARYSLSPHHHDSGSAMLPHLLSPRASPGVTRRKAASLSAQASQPTDSMSAAPWHSSPATPVDDAEAGPSRQGAAKAPAFSSGAQALVLKGGNVRDAIGRRVSRRTRMINASVAAAGAVDPLRPFNRRSLHLARLDQTLRQLHEPDVTPASLITQLRDLDLGPEEVREVLRRHSSGSGGGSSGSTGGAGLPSGEEPHSPTPGEEAAEDTFDEAGQDAAADAIKRKRIAASARASLLQRRGSSGIYRAYSAVYHRSLKAPFGPPTTEQWGTRQGQGKGAPALPSWADTRRFETTSNVLWHMLSQVRVTQGLRCSLFLASLSFLLA